MKKGILPLFILLFNMGFAVSLSAQTKPLNNGEAAINSNQNSSATIVQPNQSTVISTNKTVVSEDGIPSSFKFLLEFCVLTDGIYYLPKTKFNELTEQQQTSLKATCSKIVIKD